MKTEIIDNLKKIDANIAELCKTIGKDRKDIFVTLATKTQSIEDIRTAMATGIPVSCGENRVQEFTDKYTPEIPWDFIGQLQTNKVKYLVGRVNLIQSVDREELALAIEKEAAKKNTSAEILIEVNVGEEPQKGGVFPEKLAELLRFCEGLSHLKLRGLMTVAPDIDDPSPYFLRLAELFREYAKNYTTFKYISAGMSKDYLIAIKCGANMVRLGSVVFGAREPLHEK